MALKQARVYLVTSVKGGSGKTITLKVLAESLGYDIETDSFESLVQSYLNKKSNLNDYDKTRYLKVLLYYLIILITSVLGGMIGISKKKEL